MIVPGKLSRLYKMGAVSAQALPNGMVISMMYWFGVYSLVVIGGLLPFALLYLVSLALWLSYGAVKSATQTLKHAVTAVREPKRTSSLPA